MFLKFFNKFVILILLLGTSIAYAKTEEDKVPCPSVSNIQRSFDKIDRVGNNDFGFLAETSKPAFHENDYSWYITAFSLKVDSVNEQEIIEKGKEALSKTYIQKAPYATRYSDLIVYCNYGPTDVMAMGMFAKS